ncbi:adenosylcobinamide-GDP ribazoletransferase [Magnetococcus sp. PR-3]|uniref:adenosylcobinamide-GDP ribazoletransferase n=1 Tax=Magnetococcus sp. PR-3 TaxID=3120355 RepID=UPI002FCE1EF2
MLKSWNLHIWWPLCAAVRLLSRFPFPEPGAWSGVVQGRAVAFYPLVGMAIGLLMVLPMSWLGTQAPALGAAVATLIWVWLTGGLHLDGVADSADAWMGGLGNRERTLEIMKDPHTGPAGVVSLVLVLLLKFAALHTLLQLQMPLWIVVFTPMLARLAVGLLFLTTPYVSTQGMAQDTAAHLPRYWIWLLVGLGWFYPLFFFDPWLAMPMQASALMLWFVMWIRTLNRLGGFTGDVAGALVEWSEVVMLVTVTGVVASGWLPEG